MKKFAIIGLLASLLAAQLQPVPARAAEHAETRGDACNTAESKRQPAPYFNIDEDGVLLRYYGMEEVVTVPDGVKKIGKGAFHFNNYVQKVLLPDTVTEIDISAFRDCDNLTAVEGGSLVRIQENAFSSSLIREIDLSKVKIIEWGAFWGCEMLDEANLEAVEVLGDYAFYGCENLRTVTGLARLREIGSSVFNDTPLRRKYSGDEAKDALWITNGILLMGHHSAGRVVIPDYVTRIAPDAFCSSDSDDPYINRLETVIIPDSVTEIGDNAFAYCRNLTTVRMEDSVTKIGADVFKNCQKLTDIRLSNALTDIDPVFSYCEALEHLTLPAALEKLGKDAFSYCANLKTLTIPPQLKDFGDDANGADYDPQFSVQTIYVTDIAEAGKLENIMKKCGAKVAELKLTEENIVLGVGSGFALRFNSGAKAEKWRSSNKKVVLVDRIGNLRAMSAGTATITAAIYGREYKCVVKVIRKSGR